MASPVIDISDAELLAALADGLTWDTAARRLGCSARTLRRRMTRIKDELGAESTIAAVAAATRRGII